MGARPAAAVGDARRRWPHDARVPRSRRHRDGRRRARARVRGRSRCRDATREGLRRLCLLQLSTTVGKLEAQLPASLAHGPLVAPGAPMSPKRQIVLRALDEAFRLTEPDTFPRNKAAFLERFASGRDSLPGVLAQLERAAVELSGELEKVRLSLKTLAGRPGPTRAALDDIQSQLGRLAPPDLMRVTPVGRLGHISRNLKAIVMRLQRLSHDPQKDQQKAVQVAPFWQSYQKKRDELRAKGHIVVEIEEFGWLLEEFCVQTFAPELKTATSVSAQRLHDLWSKLAR